MADQRRRADDGRMDDLKNDLAEFVLESREFRSETKKSIEKLDQTFNGFRDKFEPMLEESLQERVWWKQTISEAKRKGVVTVLSVGTLAFVGGLILGIKTYWHKIFHWL
jgi:ABC-type transporter Mla maintaining outer membrane lipid asymmetry permease subunit MlaE